MAETDSVLIHHILVALGAAVAESNGDEALSRCLQAETRLRLITMSDKELWELAKIAAAPPEIPVESVYRASKHAIEEHKATASEWIKDLTKGPILDREGRDDR